MHGDPSSPFGLRRDKKGLEKDDPSSPCGLRRDKPPIATRSATAEADGRPETAAPAEIEAAPEEDETPNPAPESGTAPRPEKKLSLINAAAQVLAACRTPMNRKEIIAKAVEMELWVPTGGKTPEQTLYSGIFREIKTSEEPRFKKSETRKGSFEYAK